MAQKNERVTGSNRDRVRRFLAEHPGAHRCTEIGAGTGLSTHQAAIAAYGIFQEAPGDIMRGHRAATNGGRPFQTYAASHELVARLGSVGAPGQGEA